MTKFPIPAIAILLAASISQLSPAAAPTPPAPPASGPLQRIEESTFGTMPDGTIVKLYTLKNAHNITAKVMTYGAIIAGMEVPDKDGKLASVVAAPANWQATQRFNMLAQTIGPVANRVGGNSFSLDGKDFPMEGNNTLHSGSANTGTKNWQAKPLEPKPHESAVEMSYTHKDATAGFPGNIHFSVTFTLNDDNEFSLQYQATTDKPTIINLTNHTYWNLNGYTAATVPGTNQELWLDADKYLATNPQLIPTDEVLPVKDTPYDFTKPAILGSHAPQRGYDTPFVLNSGGGKIAPAARLRDPVSGRILEIRTDQPGIQVYTGQRTGVALETQHHPDSIHHDTFPTTILKPGDTFKTTTIYAFSAK
ncbi:MAG TPA: aldose epimerase family protein [Phycisphaerae bacterium]